MIERRHGLVVRILLIGTFGLAFGGVLTLGAGFPGRHERLAEARLMVERLSQAAESGVSDDTHAWVLEMRSEYEDLADSIGNSVIACWCAVVLFSASGALLGFFCSQRTALRAAAESQPRWAAYGSEGSDQHASD